MAGRVRRNQTILVAVIAGVAAIIAASISPFWECSKRTPQIVITEVRSPISTDAPIVEIVLKNPSDVDVVVKSAAFTIAQQISPAGTHLPEIVFDISNSLEVSRRGNPTKYQATGVFSDTSLGWQFRLYIPVGEPIPAGKHVRLTLVLPSTYKAKAREGDMTMHLGQILRTYGGQITIVDVAFEGRSTSLRPNVEIQYRSRPPQSKGR